MRPRTKLKTAILVGYLFSASLLYAAPSSLSVNASGTLSNGASITITGSGFGSNASIGTSSVEFLGGANGPIESGATGSEFSRTNWSIDTEFGNDIQYSTNSVPWGTKVLQMTGTATSSGSGYPEAPLYYKFPSAVTSSDNLFISWWQRTTFTGNGQYKILRLSDTQTIVDNPGHQDVWFYHNNSGGITYGIDGGPYALYPAFSPASPQSTWQRVDLNITTSSPNSVVITQYTTGSSPQTASASSYSSSASSYNWNYIVWQNYFGTDGSGTMTQGDVWFKDIYISHGTPARVELCDSSTWSNRQTCFIQPASAWSATSATVTLNQGSFTNGSTVYAYVVDSTGTANSSGYAVTIGGSAASGPATPANLTVTVQ